MLVVADTTPLHYLVSTDSMWIQASISAPARAPRLPWLNLLPMRCWWTNGMRARARRRGRRLIDIREKLALLRTMTFHTREDLFEALLERRLRRDRGELYEP